MRLPPLQDLPGRDEAREAAQRELAHHRYRAAEPPWFVRLVRWLLRQLDELLGRASDHLPGGGWGLLVLFLLLVGLAAVVVVKLRPTARGVGGALLFDGGGALTADQHRALADRAAARGEHAEAVRERLRAVVRELEARGVVEPRPGRTADEVALEAGRVLPAAAAALRDGARLFDEVWYGGRTADASSYAVLVALDERVVATRLVPA
ncbi:MAG TPA: DUF4129 domain-containing protein [Mycobacteriales bacterium]|nr:DUF4129 domain-containing protein [Mycobacteriales bacterium]